jgi:hypothetical protein
VKVITGTSGEAIHVLDGLLNHDSAIDILAHHADGGGVSDHVFAVMYLLSIRFRSRMSSPNDRRFYAFESKSRYGVLTPFMGEWLDRKLIQANWDGRAARDCCLPQSRRGAVVDPAKARLDAHARARGRLPSARADRAQPRLD